MLRNAVGWLSPLLISILIAAPASGQDVNTQPNQTITIRGILSGSLYWQDANFGPDNGQKAEFVASEERARHGGDVRNTRVTLGINGPEVRTGWRANGTFEIDFFGPFASAGNFGDEQPLPRLRLAYVDVTNGRTTIRVGQAWSLTLGNIPVSNTHVGFPLGWGPGGFIGWRFPGAWFITTLSGQGAPTATRLSLAVMRGSWSVGETSSASDQFSAGELDTPQFEGRLDVVGPNLGWYVVGHWDSKEGVGPGGTELTSWAGQAGVNLTSGGVTFHGNAHYGKAMGHHFAQIMQFGDIQGWGAWAQASFNLSPTWSLWGYAGTEQPDEADVRASGNTILKSFLVVPMLRYKSGPYSYSLEWLYNSTTYSTGPTTEEDRTGNQLAFSIRFDF